jgi:hypothetical protein
VLAPAEAPNCRVFCFLRQDQKLLEKAANSASSASVLQPTNNPQFSTERLGLAAFRSGPSVRLFLGNATFSYLYSLSRGPRASRGRLAVRSRTPARYVD